ncbi:hypothetical protein AAVH_25093 [Aphelenchoides avenae]|nr:hypothetical protein AAVH_25093 [Aphelenchus avenae]
MNIGSIDFFMWDGYVRTWLDVCDRLKSVGHRLDGIGWKMKVDDYPDFPIEAPPNETTLLVLANEMSWYYGMDPYRLDNW